MNITLDRLKYFIEAATFEHVGQAAKNLAISPSVISAAIITLEQELKCELFIRQKNRIKLNVNGQELLGQARKILDATNQLYADVANAKANYSGHYRIGASASLVSDYLLKPWFECFGDQSDLTTEIVSSDSGVLVSQMLAGQLDLALIYSPFEHQDLEEQVLVQGQFYIAVAKGHPLLKKSVSNKVVMLGQLPAITYRASAGPNICENHPMFRKFGINPKHRYFYDNDDFAIELMLKSGGWALMPENLIVKHPDKLAKVSLGAAWNAPMRISCLTRKNRSYSAVITRFKAWLLGK